MKDDGFKLASEAVLDAARAQSFATLTPKMEGRTHLSLVKGVFPKKHVLQLVDREIEVPEDSILVFEDQMPGANFGHPCRYLFHAPEDGRLIQAEDALFPPEVADPTIQLETFHAPMARELVRPVLLHPDLWEHVKPWPWVVDDNRFALLFTSQISNRRHVEDLEFCYRMLLHRFGFPASNIYVLCYDGKIGATDATAAEMSTWVGDGTAYQMKVSSAATKANLESTLKEISERMNENSLLFVHTNNHGSPDGLCVDSSSVITPAEWKPMLSGMKTFGTLVVTMEQCYSGAFLNPTLEASKATRTSFASAVPADKVSWGAAHFDPWAQTWFESLNGVTAYGASLPHDPDTNHDGRISMREAFNYSDAYDPAEDDPQYGETPAGCGEQIFFTKPPSLAEIIQEILKKYRRIEKLVPKHPIPDPPPEWSFELLASLSTAEALVERLDAAAPDGGRAGAARKEKAHA